MISFTKRFLLNGRGILRLCLQTLRVSKNPKGLMNICRFRKDLYHGIKILLATF